MSKARFKNHLWTQLWISLPIFSLRMAIIRQIMAMRTMSQFTQSQLPSLTLPTQLLSISVSVRNVHIHYLYPTIPTLICKHSTSLRSTSLQSLSFPSQKLFFKGATTKLTSSPFYFFPLIFPPSGPSNFTSKLLATVRHVNSAFFFVFPTRSQPSLAFGCGSNSTSKKLMRTRTSILTLLFTPSDTPTTLAILTRRRCPCACLTQRARWNGSTQ